MSLDYKIQAIDVWPGERTPSYRRTRSPFKTVWTSVLSHLSKELRHLGGRNVVLKLGVSPRDVRQDGMLRADARPQDPGVIIQFVAGRLKGSPTLLYRCDRFPFWQDNVSAIARGLEALRLVDRYGVTPTGEQYAGFKALPSSTDATLTTEKAAQIIEAHSSVGAAAILHEARAANDAIRVARHRTHPDRNNGQSDLWTAVERARVVLSSHHGVTF